MHNLLNMCILIFATSSSCIAAIADVEIICKNIEKLNFRYIGSILTCIGSESINSTCSESSVASIIDNDGVEVTDSVSIECLNIKEATFYFIPMKLTKKLPNLRALRIVRSNLMVVRKNNLKEIGSSLEYLDVTYNNLTFIDEDLFEYNPNLIAVFFYNNPISHINTNFYQNFKLLKNVIVAEFHPGTCLNHDFSSGAGHRVETFEWNHDNCSNVIPNIESELKIVKKYLCSYSNDEDYDYVAKVSVNPLKDYMIYTSSFSYDWNWTDSTTEDHMTTTDEMEDSIETEKENDDNQTLKKLISSLILNQKISYDNFIELKNKISYNNLRVGELIYECKEEIFLLDQKLNYLMEVMMQIRNVFAP